MSADNGVYILQTGRQYRVAHLQAIDNLYWDDIAHRTCKTPQPRRIQEMFGDCKYTYNQDTAMRIAVNMYKHLPICEYGIVLINAKITWKNVLAHSTKK